MYPCSQSAVPAAVLTTNIQAIQHCKCLNRVPSVEGLQWFHTRCSPSVCWGGGGWGSCPQTCPCCGLPSKREGGNTPPCTGHVLQAGKGLSEQAKTQPSSHGRELGHFCPAASSPTAAATRLCCPHRGTAVPLILPDVSDNITGDCVAARQQKKPSICSVKLDFLKGLETPEQPLSLTKRQQVSSSVRATRLCAPAGTATAFVFLLS